jgi:hypothetical protein
MLRIIREMDLGLVRSRNRAARSTEDFSRPFGEPFRLISRAQSPAQEFRLPVTWNEQPVEFSLAPVIQEKRHSRAVHLKKRIQ